MSVGKKRFFLFLLGLTAILAMFLAAIFGVVHLSWQEVFQSGTTHAQIFWKIRIPRVLIGFFAGAGLSMAGMVFQVVFLNPLATPYTLGVSSGSSFGAALIICLGGLPGVFGYGGTAIGALLGGGLTVALILLFSRTKLGHQRPTMLLAGVAISFFFSSLLLLVQYLANFYQSFQIIRWLMGGISVAGYAEIVTVFPVVLLVFLWLLKGSAKLNLLLLGDDLAQARGLAVGRSKKQLVIAVSLMVAIIVSVTGPIGFVGMVIPHICRLLWGNQHQFLVPCVALIGGITLVLCDLVARLLLAPNEMPVGIITSLIGAPVFFYLLLNRPFRL